MMGLFRSLFGRGPRVPQPDTETVGWTDIRDQLSSIEGVESEELFRYDRESASWDKMDSKYTIPTQEDLEKILELDGEIEGTYSEDIRDCDDFAMKLRCRLNWEYGITGVGLVVSWSDDAHVFNLVCTQDGPVIIEPQNAEIVILGEEYHGFDEDNYDFTGWCKIHL